MPLQHASPSVLKRMKRGAGGDIFLKLLERVRRTIPGVAIRTSFIVGFPGESAQDFDQLCQFVEAAKFDNLGVFTYSDEDTSASYALDGKVDARTMQNRKRRLMAIQRRRARNRAWWELKRVFWYPVCRRNGSALGSSRPAGAGLDGVT
jgi:ribosomal protein S12 methylthiotransferase